MVISRVDPSPSSRFNEAACRDTRKSPRGPRPLALGREASMRPRVETRGNKLIHFTSRHNMRASMRPRVETRGNREHQAWGSRQGARFNEAACRDTRKCDGSPPGLGSSSSFNEAACRDTRKSGERSCSGRRHSWASMRPRVETRGNTNKGKA